MADQFAENDVESLGIKLEQFSKTLTSGEHAALVEILDRATPQEDDVEGYSTKSTARAASTRSIRMVVSGALGVKRHK